MTWKDGHIYEGTWNDTEEGLQGKGVMCSPEGRKEEGKWINNSWKRSFSYKIHFTTSSIPFKNTLFLPWFLYSLSSRCLSLE